MFVDTVQRWYAAAVASLTLTSTCVQQNTHDCGDLQSEMLDCPFIYEAPLCPTYECEQDDHNNENDFFWNRQIGECGRIGTTESRLDTNRLGCKYNMWTSHHLGCHCGRITPTLSFRHTLNGDITVGACLSRWQFT
jgi:hypothetical protein